MTHQIILEETVKRPISPGKTQTMLEDWCKNTTVPFMVPLQQSNECALIVIFIIKNIHTNVNIILCPMRHFQQSNLVMNLLQL